MPEPDPQRLSDDQESQLVKERDRGHRAGRIVQDEIFVESVSAMRERFLDEWQNSPIRDAEGRERIYLMVRILDLLVQELTSVMETGQSANTTLQAFEERKKKLRLFGRG